MPRATGPVLVALVVAAALLGGPAPTRAQPADERTAIQDLLDRRAQAMLEGDFEGFLDSVGHTQAFRDRQRILFEGFQQVPLEDYELVANWERYGELTRRQDRARYDGYEDVAIVLVEEHYRLKGFDPEPAVEDAYLTFVKDDGAWLIADDNDLDGLGLFSVRHPWEFGDLDVERDGRFLVISRTGSNCSGVPAGLTSHARAGLDRVETYWTRQWNKRVVMIIPCNGKELQRMLQATFDPSQFVAFAYSTIDTSDGYDYTGHRVIVNPPVFAGRPSEQVLTIMAHELLHVASREVSGPFVPLFVEEGIADLVGYGEADRALVYFDSVVAAGGFDGRIPDDYEFSTGTSSTIFLSYQKSQSAIRYFVERFGLGRLGRFYEVLGSRKFVVGLAEWQVDDALRATVGMGLDRFEREWAASIGS